MISGRLFVVVTMSGNIFETHFNQITWYLRLLGIFKPNDSVLYFIYKIFVYTILNLTCLSLILQIIRSQNVDELTQVCFSSITILLTTVKIYVTDVNQKRIRKLFELTNNPIFQPKSAIVQHEIRAIFVAFERMYSFMFWTPLMVITIWVIDSLMSSDKNALPVQAYYPFDLSPILVYRCVYLQQLCSLIICGQAHNHCDYLSIFLVVIAIGQYKILMNNLRNLKRDIGEKLMNQRLIECIKHHQLIIAYYYPQFIRKYSNLIKFSSLVKEINEIYNGLYFGQFVTSAGALCFTLVQLSLPQANMARLLGFGLYQIGMLVQIFAFCIWGNGIIVESESLPFVAIECDWLDGTREFKRNLLFFICCAQKTATLYAIDLFQVSLRSFLQILKHAYSFFALLRHMNTRTVD